jgi:hypothetical protein
MNNKKKLNWFERQKQPLARRISWYWFVNPETPTSISLKLYPRNNFYLTKQRIRKPRPFVSKYVSSNKKSANKEGYKDYTPKHYFDTKEKEGGIKYEKARIYLNLNFLFEYLTKKGVDLDLFEKEMLNEFFNNWKIRKFLFEWNKEENKELSFSNYKNKIEVYDFERDVVEAVITFIRCIFLYDHETIIRHVFDQKILEKYANIINLVEDFIRPRHKSSRKLNRSLYDKRRRMADKIEDSYERIPILLKKTILTKKYRMLEEKMLNSIKKTPKKIK